MLGIIEAGALAASISADSLAAGFVYGSKRIRVPVGSLWVVNLICCGVLGGAMILGHLARPMIPAGLAAAVAFVVLLCIGIVKLADGIVRNLIRKNSVDRKINFSAFNLRFILHVYANPEAADADTSAHLSAGEAVALALALSLDGMAVGFAAALAGVNPWALLAWSLALNPAAMVLGQLLGQRLARRFDVSWLGGVVLIILAFTRFLA